MMQMVHLDVRYKKKDITNTCVWEAERGSAARKAIPVLSVSLILVAPRRLINVQVYPKLHNTSSRTSKELPRVYHEHEYGNVAQREGE